MCVWAFRRRTRSRAPGVLVGTVKHSRISLVLLEHNKLPEATLATHSLPTVYFDNRGLDAVQPNTDDRFR